MKIFIVLSIFTLLSQVGGSPKFYLVGKKDDHKYLVGTKDDQAKDDHKKPMMPGDEAVWGDDDGTYEEYYSDEYWDETSKILCVFCPSLQLFSNRSAWDYKLILIIGLNHQPTIHQELF